MTQLRIGVIGCYGRGGMAMNWHKPDEGHVVAGACDVADGALDWFKNNVNVSLGHCRPCWWSRPAWGTDCPKGHATCRNMPTPRDAADIVAQSIEEMAECTSPS